MLVERTVTLDDDEEFVVKVRQYFGKELEINLPQLDCKVYLSRRKAQDIINAFSGELGTTEVNNEAVRV